MMFGFIGGTPLVKELVKLDREDAYNFIAENKQRIKKKNKTEIESDDKIYDYHASLENKCSIPVSQEKETNELEDKDKDKDKDEDNDNDNDKEPQPYYVYGIRARREVPLKINDFVAVQPPKNEEGNYWIGQIYRLDVIKDNKRYLFQ